jgi:hypothetical protein
MSDWTEPLFAELAMKLARGGWSEALDIHSRVDDVLRDMTGDELRLLWLPTHTGTKRIDGKKLARLIRCNIASHEVHRLQEYVSGRLRELDLIGGNAAQLVRPQNPAWSRTGLRAELSTINLLSDGSSASLLFRPYPKTEIFAKRFTPSSGIRTPSMGPEEAASLLTGAVRWIESIGPVLHDVLLEFLEEYKRRPDAYAGFAARSKLFAKCPSLPALERALGCRVARTQKLRGANADKGETSLYSAIKLLYAACFIVVTIFNARRKDEVQHPVLGLQINSLALVDQELGLYVCSFYIEKTVRDYVPFYVGQLTATAINTLGRFSRIAHDFAALKRSSATATDDAASRSIFAMPSLPSSHEPRKFDFYSAAKWENGMEGLQREWLPRSLRPHMLRRAYALIFHYRYENATLQALSQQLQHLDIEMTRLYVSDSVGTAVSKTGISLYGRLTPFQRSQIEADQVALSADLKDVANEKLILFIESVVIGKKTFSGGYARLVQRFHQQLGKAISYRALEMRAQAEQLGTTLIARGHQPLPMPHGTCMVGTSVSRLRGHCFDTDAGDLDRSNASPSKCAHCSYHVVAEQHLTALRAEYEWEQSKMHQSVDQTSLQHIRRVSDLASLRRLIELHAQRLKKDNVNEADPLRKI